MSKEIIVKMTADHIKVKGGEYVQDLVRCRDCANTRVMGSVTHFLYCAKFKRDVNPCDFCSWSERKEGER